MELNAKVVQQLPLQSGKTQKGKDWTKATAIVETLEMYPRQVAVTCFNNAEQFAQIPVGTQVSLEVAIDSREYNGRWYTDVTCQGWRLEPGPEDAGTGYGWGVGIV